MLKQEGIYGTIGILCKKPENYPKSDFIRLGWSDEIRFTKEVDFVGHSWFLKKEWLSCMFNNTEKYQEYKRAGEDMCLSLTAKKQLGIKTFVPPHPTRHHNLWGSLPEFAVLLGTNNAAISNEKNNKEVRNKFIRELIKDGYEFLSYTNSEYVKKMFKGMKKAKILTKYIPQKDFRHYLRSKLKEFFLK